MLSCSPSHAAAITLRFQSKVNSQAMQLGDVVRIENDKYHWRNLHLDSHPVPGEVITKDQMIAWMTQHLGAFNSTWQGKTRIQVEHSTLSSEKMLIEKATTALMNKLKPNYRRISVKSLSHPNASTYALDEFKTKITVPFPVSKRVCVWLTHKNKRIPIWFKVSAYANVLVANRDIHYNTSIQDDAFSRKERNIAGLTASPAQTLPKQFWLTATIKRNTILLDTQLKDQPLIVHGQPIKVTVHHHAITLVVDAIALTDGALGQTITVKNPQTQQTFVAKTTGIQRAELSS